MTSEALPIDMANGITDTKTGSASSARVGEDQLPYTASGEIAMLLISVMPASQATSY